ncbi:hypothetical protein GEMRC1_004032 [Eukaryota sp. GEM-RC1]
MLTSLSPTPWAFSTEEICKKYDVLPSDGLSAVEVQKRQRMFGTNVLPMPKPPSFLSLVLDQFKDTMVVVLIISALISFFLAFFEHGSGRLTAFVEPWVIIAILIINASIGVIQERRSHQAISALKQLTTTRCFVRRQKRLLELDADLIVPGDIIEVRAGHAIPADCRVLAVTSSHELYIDQSAFSGEPEPVYKDHTPVYGGDLLTHDLSCMVFAGSTVVAGTALCLVTSTGGNTKLGSIGESLSEDSPPSPVEKKLDEFGILLGKIILIICIIVWLLNIPQFARSGSVLNGAIQYFKVAVALGVAAIPEGLPAVVTTCLALGSSRMAKKKAIVRHLGSVEALGSATVVLTDKTGTLTTNKMTVKRLITFDPNCRPVTFEIDGLNFEPRGRVLREHGRDLASDDRVLLEQVADVCVVCNDAMISYSETDKEWNCIGDSTEGALLSLAEKIVNPNPRSSELLVDSLRSEKRRHRVRTIDFTRSRKRMTVITETGIYVKGALETVLPLCESLCLPSTDSFGSPLTAPLSLELTEVIEDQAKMLASSGYRVLALAARSTVNATSTISIEHGLTFIVPDAIDKCFTAGIKVVIVTGDAEDTAVAIAERIGLVTRKLVADERYCCMSGKEFHSLSPQQRSDVCNNLTILYRVEPEHKELLVKTFQEKKEIVCMIGDGVNDSIAIKKADIGISVGSGTAVAQSAADIVLADSNFATLVDAIEEGRSIFANMQQFIRYLVSSNIGEVLCIFFAVLLRLPEVLIPVQLLWVNLTTDSSTAIALSFNPPDKEILSQPPRDPKLPIVGRNTFIRYMVIGTWVGTSTIIGYIWWFLWADHGPKISWYELTHAKDCVGDVCDILASPVPVTIALTILVVIEMLNALNSISETSSLLVFPPNKNWYVVVAIIFSMILHFWLLYTPVIAKIFSVAPLSVADWKAIMILSIPVILIDEVTKFFIRRKRSLALVRSRNLRL